LTSEINRIGNTTEFNTQRVLKGADDPIELKPALALDGLGLSDPVIETSGGQTHAAEGAQVALNISGVTGGDVSGAEITFNLQGHEITLVFKRVSDGSEPPGPEVTADGTEVTVTVASSASGGDVADAIKAGLEAAIAANANIGADAYTIEVSGAAVSISSSATGLDQFINVNVTDADDILESGSILFATGKDVTYTASQAKVGFSGVTIAELAGKGITINNQSIEFYNADEGVYQGEADFAVNISAVSSGGELVAAIANQLGDKLDGVKLSAGSGSNLFVTATANGEAGNGIVIADGVDRPAVTADGKFVARLQVGSNEGQSMTIEIADMRARALGITGSGEGFTSELVVTDGTSNEMQEAALDVSTHESASKAVTIIDKAIEAVSTQRSQLGAFQNRLEHTISNLGTSAENLQAAESRIRDLDMAEEIMAFTKNNILQQAATAMLAQGNMAPQSVLQLLG
jgi:flagellin